jgi:hypothetical protein
MSTKKKLLEAAAGNAGEAVYVDDVFSTYLWTGDGADRDIVNGIDLAGEGGLVWFKNREDTRNHALFDTETDPTGQYYLISNTNGALNNTGASQITYNSDGFRIADGTSWNANGNDMVSWTFRKQPGFFDVVTFEAPANADDDFRVSHNLGTVPGMIIVKSVDATGDWYVWHRSFGNRNDSVKLNSSNASAASGDFWGESDPTATDFGVQVRNFATRPVTTGAGTYVAYIFAHDAQEFGTDSDESIIKCGSYTGNGNSNTGPVIDLGFEPQFLIIKDASNANNWVMQDVMRGIVTNGNDPYLHPNSTSAETGAFDSVDVTSTGFKIKTSSSSFNYWGATYIYMAIRRPMKTPEAGTEVFMADTRASSGGTLAEFISGFPVDMYLRYLTVASFEKRAHTRLLGETKLITNTNAAKVADTTVSFASNVGAGPSGESVNTAVLAHMFRRAPGFLDVVAYTGDYVNPISHNLGVAPELIITKEYAHAWDWYSWGSVLGANKFVTLNSNAAATNYTFNTTVTATTFMSGISSTSQPTIAYLFATLEGVSKVGSYTGTGNDLNVDCGFSAGARFILIKRTDSTGDWYVWDYYRGIVAGNDPYLLLNSLAAQVTNTDYIDPLASGFTVTSSAPAALNASGGTYIFLAIA